MKRLAFLFAVLFGFQVLAAQLTVEEKTLDFQQLVGRFKASYGPLHYKKEKFGIDLDVLQAKYLREVQQSKSNTEFYYIIARFVAEFQDSHSAAILPTDKKAALPFLVDLVQGQALIDKIDTDTLPEDKFPFKRGDELVAIDGIPVADLIKDLGRYAGEGFEQTQKRYATWLLTTRRARRLPSPSGQAVVTIRPQGKTEARTQTVEWKVTGEDSPETLTQMLERVTTFHSGSFLRQASIKDNLTGLFGETRADGKEKLEIGYACSGTTRIEKPENATVVSEEPFVSYYWPTEKGNIGYLRIPHYSPDGDDAEKAIAGFFAQYEKAISVLEKNTVGLVIDQDHNCGGYVDLVNAMLGLFMDQPYHPMNFRLVANKENYLEYKKYVDETDKLSLNYDNLVGVMNKLKDAWIKGEHMTPHLSLNGNEWEYPNPVRYTKPVVMLIDEMSGSGGDAFPSMMKGYGRAKLIGTRTMGAGGHVDQNAPLNYSQITVSMTRSLFFRPDGVPVENNGAVPDYPYEITADDFINGYKGYRAFYTQKILEQVQ